MVESGWEKAEREEEGRKLGMLGEGWKNAEEKLTAPNILTAR